jgi:hypothetical protein
MLEDSSQSILMRKVAQVQRVRSYATDPRLAIFKTTQNQRGPDNERHWTPSIFRADETSGL